MMKKTLPSKSKLSKPLRGLYGSGVFLIVSIGIILPFYIIALIFGIPSGRFSTVNSNFSSLVNTAWDAIDEFIKDGTFELIDKL